MRRLSFLFALASAAVVGACSSSSGTPATGGATCTAAGSASVSGTFLGATFSAKDAVAYPSGASSGFVVVTDFSGECSFVGTNDLKASSSVLVFDFLDTAIAAGTFDTTAVDVQYAAYDANCHSPQGESASGGTVTITSVDSGTVQGTFDVTLNTDHVTGSFTAPLLAQPATSTAATVCR